jgi:uncharacterized protein (DUF433 family)
MKDYKEILSINTEIRFGKPCVRSTRISVYDVLTLLASGMSKSEIIQDYPELTEEDILLIRKIKVMLFKDILF